MHLRGSGLCRSVALLVIATLAMAALPACGTALAQSPQSGTFGSVDRAAGTITLEAPKTLKLPPDPALSQSTLGTFSKGDTVRFTVSSDGQALAHIDKASVAVAVWPRIIAMLVALGVVLGAGLVASRFRLRAFLIGADERYSNSKTQLALWSTTVFTAYLATLLLRVWATGNWHYVGGVDIPGNLLALSGLSALTFAGAKAVTTQKIDTAREQDRKGLPFTPKKPNTGQPSLISDLFQNDNGETDIGDFQMILIAVVAAVIYVISIYVFLGQIELSASITLPDVDTTLLAGFGVGQGAYLTKKAASDLGAG